MTDGRIEEGPGTPCTMSGGPIAGDGTRALNRKIREAPVVRLSGRRPNRAARERGGIGTPCHPRHVPAGPRRHDRRHGGAGTSAPTPTCWLGRKAA